MVSRRGSGGGEDEAPPQGHEEDQGRVWTPERRDDESWTWIETPKGGCLHWQEDGELQEEEVEEFEEGLDCDARLERVLASIKAPRFIDLSVFQNPSLHGDDDAESFLAMDECELKLEFGGDGVLPGAIGEGDDDDWEASITPQFSGEVFGQSSFSSVKGSPFGFASSHRLSKGAADKPSPGTYFQAGAGFPSSAGDDSPWKTGWCGVAGDAKTPGSSAPARSGNGRKKECAGPGGTTARVGSSGSRGHSPECQRLLDEVDAILNLGPLSPASSPSSFSFQKPRQARSAPTQQHHPSHHLSSSPSATALTKSPSSSSSPNTLASPTLTRHSLPVPATRLHSVPSARSSQQQQQQQQKQLIVGVRRSVPPGGTRKALKVAGGGVTAKGGDGGSKNGCREGQGHGGDEVSSVSSSGMLEEAGVEERCARGGNTNPATRVSASARFRAGKEGSQAGGGGGGGVSGPRVSATSRFHASKKLAEAKEKEKDKEKDKGKGLDESRVVAIVDLNAGDSGAAPTRRSSSKASSASSSLRSGDAFARASGSLTNRGDATPRAPQREGDDTPRASSRREVASLRASAPCGKGSAKIVGRDQPVRATTSCIGGDSGINSGVAGGGASRRGGRRGEAVSRSWGSSSAASRAPTPNLRSWGSERGERTFLRGSSSSASRSQTLVVEGGGNGGVGGSVPVQAARASKIPGLRGGAGIFEVDREGKGTSEDGKGASADGKDASADGKGASADGKGASADGKVASADGKVASADGKGASSSSAGKIVGGIRIGKRGVGEAAVFGRVRSNSAGNRLCAR